MVSNTLAHLILVMWYAPRSMRRPSRGVRLDLPWTFNTELFVGIKLGWVLMSEVVSALDISKFYYITKWVKYMDLAQISL